jgi:hypothetical protein
VWATSNDWTISNIKLDKSILNLINQYLKLINPALVSERIEIIYLIYHIKLIMKVIVSNSYLKSLDTFSESQNFVFALPESKVLCYLGPQYQTFQFPIFKDVFPPPLSIISILTSQTLETQTFAFPPICHFI